MVVIKLVLLCVMFYISYSKITIEPKMQSRPLKSLIKVAVKAYQNFCELCRNTLIIHDESDRHSSNFFLRMISKRDFNMSLVSYSIGYDERPWTLKGVYNRDVIELTIIFWTKRFYNSVHEFLNIIENIPYWNRYSRIVITAVDEIPTEYTSWMENIFSIFWKRKILRIFLTFLYNNQIKIFMYNPFNYTYALDISNRTDKEYNEILEYELIDLYGYPIKAFVYDVLSYKERFLPGPFKDDLPTWVGHDGKFMSQVRDVLNSTMDITRESETNALTRYVKIVDEENYSRKNFLNYYDFDIWFTALRAIKNAEIDYVFLHERDDFCFVVPKGKPVPQYLYMFLVVPIKMWLFSAISFIVIVLFLYILKRNSPLQDTYRMMLNVPLMDITKPLKNPLRLIISTWLVFCFVFSIVFNCSLMSTLLLRKYYPDPDTLEDLIRINITIYTSTSDYELLAQNIEKKAILKQIINMSECTVDKMVAKHNEQNGFLVRSEIARSFLKEMKKFDDRLIYTIMKEHPIPSASAYIMPKNHPYYEEVIWNINKVHESGLYYLWRKSDFGYTERETNTSLEFPGVIHVAQSDSELVKLSLYHLQSAFYILEIGVLFALVVFILEYASLRYPKLRLKIFYK